MDYAHRSKILHRDVKPDNILIRHQDFKFDPEMDVQLIDLGLASQIRSTMSRISQQKFDNSGTKPYMSPEQWRGKRNEFSPAMDQYSLGVVLYELLSGYLPFECDDDAALYHAVQQETPDPVHDQPANVNQNLLRALAKDRTTRFGNCADFISQFQLSSSPKINDINTQATLKPTTQEVSIFEGTTAGDLKVFTDMKINFRWCPPGTFTMGCPASEKDRKTDENLVSVTLTKGFWLGEMVVTQGQWEEVVGTKPWSGQVSVQTGKYYPATYVTWDDTLHFCNMLTDIEHKAGRLKSKQCFRLPTEAEWEYACRAGTKTAYSFGDDDNMLELFAWYDKNAWYKGEKYAHEVGLKLANPWNLKDMHGNVLEWCSDWYGDKLAGGRDPKGPSSGVSRVLRGGSWGNEVVYSSSAYRLNSNPFDRSSNVGFRLVVE